MERRMLLKLKVDNILLDPIRVGDRLEFRFNAPEDLQYVTLDKGVIYGDLHLKEIQLEQSTLATTFVEPMESETVASGVFKSVQGISYEITNPGSDTWASIKQTVDGSISTYHNGTLQSTMAHTIEDIIFGISDIAGGDSSSFNLRLGGIQQSVKDQMFSSVQTQLAGFVGIQLEDIEGNYNTILNTVNAHSQTIGTDGGNVAQKVMNDSLFRTSVIDRIAGTESSYTQLSDYINLRVNGSQISIGGDNITIDSKSIFLGSSTQIANGVITDRMISSEARIDAAKISNLTVSNAQVISLDVSKLSGNKSNFVQTAWNSISSRMSADSSGLKINTTNGWDMYLNNGGVEFKDKFGKPSGRLRASLDASGNPEGTLLVSERGYKAGLGRRLTSGLLRSSLTVDGNTGSISVASDIGSNSEIRAPEYHIGQYNRLVRYVGSTQLTTVAFEHRAKVSEAYDHTTDRIWAVRSTDTMTMYANINMNGQTISNQSDIRMKKNITDSGVNALKEIERLNFVNFEWDETKGQDLKPKGVQFGIIAQHSPFLQMKTDDEESYLSVDMSKQVNLNSKASQELLAYTRSLEKRIEVLENERTNGHTSATSAK